MTYRISLRSPLALQQQLSHEMSRQNPAFTGTSTFTRAASSTGSTVFNSTGSRNRNLKSRRNQNIHHIAQSQEFEHIHRNLNGNSNRPRNFQSHFSKSLNSPLISTFSCQLEPSQSHPRGFASTFTRAPSPGIWAGTYLLSVNRRQTKE